MFAKAAKSITYKICSLEIYMLSIISWIHISSVQIFSQFCPRSRSPRITQRIAVDCFQHRLDGPLIRSVFLKPIYAFRKDSKTEWPRELPLRNWQVERLRDQAGCELLRESCPKQLGPPVHQIHRDVWVGLKPAERLQASRGRRCAEVKTEQRRPLLGVEGLVRSKKD